MRLSLIIDQLKTYAPSFAGRVSGAAEYAALKNASNMLVPACYVIPLENTTTPNESLTGYRQTVNDAFGVIVVLSNLVDERGQTAFDQLHDIRKEIFKAVLAWWPEQDTDRIEYEGATLLGLDRVRLDYQFEFIAPFDLTEADTYQGVQNAALPALQTVRIDLDHKELPPDGVIDHTIDVQPPQ